MADKYLILSRGKAAPGTEDWYEKGRSFLASQGCNDLDQSGPADLFQEAIASISALSGGSIQIDPSANVFIVTAKTSGTVSPDECLCRCGLTASCGGGGGGGGKLTAAATAKS